jgi:hypothetical protein
LSARPALIHAWHMVLCMRIIKSWILTIIDIGFIVILPIFVFLLANPMYARARVDCVVYRPVVAFPTICERTSNFFETGIQGEVVADGILKEISIERNGYE